MRIPLGLAGAFSVLAISSALAAPPEPLSITPALIEAAKKEGVISYYTAVDVKVAEKVAQAFKEKYPGIEVQVERTGAERLFQRVGQEIESGINNADVINTSDAAHALYWKRKGWLAPVLPDEVAKHFDKAHYDAADGTYAVWRATLSPIGYNTTLVKPDAAPKSFADLLDPKWKSKIVKAHPGYSGTVMTATHQIARDLGWDYLEKLAKQDVMQVQSATDPSKKIVSGERAISADGTEYNLILAKRAGAPIEIVYATEGTPFVPGPSAVLAKAPHPNAARLFYLWSFSLEGQQLMHDVGGLRSVHPGVKELEGVKPLSEIKLMKDDADDAEKQAEELKQRYAKAFGT
jgi:iron(III) transport system substrate-binding protein